jgi:hypothetical protein
MLSFPDEDLNSWVHEFAYMFEHGSPMNLYIVAHSEEKR